MLNYRLRRFLRSQKEQSHSEISSRNGLPISCDTLPKSESCVAGLNFHLYQKAQHAERRKFDLRHLKVLFQSKYQPRRQSSGLFIH